MRKVVYVFMLCVICLLTSCEKHDGIRYFKAKCVAELNGQSFIDQTPFTISPNAIITPELYYYDNVVRFKTFLRAERNGDIVFGVDINLFINAQDIVPNKEYIIEKKDFAALGANPASWDYSKYCEDNDISYASVSEIAERCTIRFTTFDTEKRHYQGIFTLNFSEGMLKGEFEI